MFVEICVYIKYSEAIKHVPEHPLIWCIPLFYFLPSESCRFAGDLRSRGVAPGRGRDRSVLLEALDGERRHHPPVGGGVGVELPPVGDLPRARSRHHRFLIYGPSFLDSNLFYWFVFFPGEGIWSQIAPDIDFLKKYEAVSAIWATNL